ncbi:hypothetical protein AB1Y20_014705 [Prymnesium parvum]|uniref:Glucose-methanol-choline oxidoreductase N-terminal domain-containing protein n=1 Tax=Prymnesium parvum TaxID=97485 RepID=A0AB34IDN0_PRYPA
MLGALCLCLSAAAAADEADVVVVGTGPGAAGFLYRLLQLQPHLTVLWLERGPLDTAVTNWPEDIAFSGEERMLDRHAYSSRTYITPFSWRGFGGGDTMNAGAPNTLGLGTLPYFPVDVWSLRNVSYVPPTVDSERWRESLVASGWTHDAGYPARFSHSGETVGRPSTVFTADGKSRRVLAQSVAAMAGVRVVRASVRRVLFEDGRAVGVEDWGGAVWFARRGVVLAGGVFGSFELLVESGIGPAKALEARGVAPRVTNEAVGRGVGGEMPLVVKHINVARRREEKVEPSLAAHSSKYKASLCWWSDGILTWWSQRNGWLDWLRFGPKAFRRLAFVAVSLPSAPAMHLEASKDGLILNDDEVEFTQEMCDGFAALAPSLEAGFEAERLAGQALEGWERVEYSVMRALLWLLTPVLRHLHSPLLTMPNPLTNFNLKPHCTKNELADYYHYYGGNGEQVVDAHYAVRGVAGLFISDASVIRYLEPGPPTASVMQEGMRVADAFLGMLRGGELPSVAARRS